MTFPDPKLLDYQDLIKSICDEKGFFKSYDLIEYLSARTQVFSTEYWKEVVAMLKDLGYEEEIDWRPACFLTIPFTDFSTGTV